MMPDGTIEHAQKKGFLSKTTGLEWLQDAQSDGRKGQFLEPSKQTFGSYGAEVIDGLRIEPGTRASYVKNWRNHVEPYPIAAMPLAQLTGVKLTSNYRVLEKHGRKDYKAAPSCPRARCAISTRSFMACSATPSRTGCCCAILPTRPRRPQRRRRRRLR